MRRPLIVGNWKMHKTVAQARALARALCAAMTPSNVEIVICPPFTALSAVSEELRGSEIALGAQTMHESDEGAFTGEVSPVMLHELGVSHVILGHSERRAYFGETDERVALKVRAALRHDLTPIVAVGETLEEHERGEAFARVLTQTRAAYEGLANDEIARCVTAYEPIWAIGTGKADEPSDSDALLARLREAMPALRETRLLYGGSMKGENAAALMAQPNIDGGLIGGASLAAESFHKIIDAAQTSVHQATRA